MTGPLKGIRILEIAGIGPGPFCAMMLADQGAEVIRIDRPGGGASGIVGDAKRDVLNRGRKSIAIDLKQPEGIALVLDMASKCDGLIEGFRPGVMERLGLGPDIMLQVNPKLVFGRMTGWGQEGPMAKAAGHDINYISTSGVLAHLARAGGQPTPPINLIGDFGGGGMLLAFGMVCALLEAKGSGKGQVIDAAMVDGAATLMMMMWGFKAMGLWSETPGVNLLDTGTHFYDTYETSDGKWISLGAIEPQFYAEFRARAGLADDKDFDAQMSPADWPKLKLKLATHFKTKTRDEWVALLEGSDACVAGILTMSEAIHHPHNVARKSFIEIGGVPQPAPAPRYSRTVNDTPSVPSSVGENSEEVLVALGFSTARIEALRDAKIIRQG
jgi:alpha-methylacyl-CoA racemase